MDSQTSLSEGLSLLIRQIRAVADCLVREQECLLETDLSNFSSVVEKKVDETERLSAMLLEWESKGLGWTPDSAILSPDDQSSLQSLKNELSLLSELASVNMILAQESGQMLTSLVRALTSDPGQFHTYNPSGGPGSALVPAPTLVSTRT